MPENGKPQIKIFHADDKSLKTLGELLSNDTSRRIIRLLIDHDMYKNEISTKLDMSVNLVAHHLKKLVELGVLEITHKQITKKGNNHKYYRMIPHLFVSPNHTEEDLEKKGTLKRFFKDGIKFASIGIVSFLTWLYKINDSSVEYSRETTLEDPLTIPLIIIIIGLTIILLKKRKKIVVNLRY